MKLLEIAKKTYSADPDFFVTVWMEVIMDYEDHPDRGKETIKNLQAAKEAGVSARVLGKEMTDHINGSEGWSFDDVSFTNAAGKKVFGEKLIDMNQLDLSDEDDWDW